MYLTVHPSIHPPSTRINHLFIRTSISSFTPSPSHPYIYIHRPSVNPSSTYWDSVTFQICVEYSESFKTEYNTGTHSLGAVKADDAEYCKTGTMKMLWGFRGGRSGIWISLWISSHEGKLSVWALVEQQYVNIHKCIGSNSK